MLSYAFLQRAIWISENQVEVQRLKAGLKVLRQNVQSLEDGMLK